MRKKLVCLLFLVVILCALGLASFASNPDLEPGGVINSDYFVILYYPTTDTFEPLYFPDPLNPYYITNYFDVFSSSPVYFLFGNYQFHLEFTDSQLTWSQYSGSTLTKTSTFTPSSSHTLMMRLLYGSQFQYREIVDGVEQELNVIALKSGQFEDLNYILFHYYAPFVTVQAFSSGYSNGFSVGQSSGYADGFSVGQSSGYSNGFIDGQNSFVLPDDVSKGYFYNPIRAALSIVVGDDVADIMVIPILVFIMLAIFIFIFTLCRYRDKYYILRGICIAIIVLVTIYCIGTFGLPLPFSSGGTT